MRARQWCEERRVNIEMRTKGLTQKQSGRIESWGNSSVYCDYMHVSSRATHPDSDVARDTFIIAKFT